MQTNHNNEKVNGPNLNLLGYREPHIYGSTTLSDVEASLKEYCASKSVHISFYQANDEGLMLDRIHACKYPQCLPKDSRLNLAALENIPPVDAIVINAGAWTHTSVALRDALGGVGIPFVEIHVSNVHKREEFRHKSFLSDTAQAVICGLGVYGYRASVEFCVEHLKV